MTNHSGNWMTIREASLTLDVSELTVRRRIKQGRLAHRLEGGKYLVNLTLPPPELKSAATVDEMPPEDAAELPGIADESHTSRSIDVAALLPDYSRLAQQAGRASVLEEQLRDLERRYAELQEGTVTLASRNGWLESKLEDRDAEIKLLADSRRKLPWWKRLFSGGASRS